MRSASSRSPSASSWSRMSGTRSPQTAKSFRFRIRIAQSLLEDARSIAGAPRTSFPGRRSGGSSGRRSELPDDLPSLCAGGCSLGSPLVRGATPRPRRGLPPKSRGLHCTDRADPRDLAAGGWRDPSRPSSPLSLRRLLRAARRRPPRSRRLARPTGSEELEGTISPVVGVGRGGRPPASLPRPSPARTCGMVRLHLPPAPVSSRPLGPVSRKLAIERTERRLSEAHRGPSVWEGERSEAFLKVSDRRFFRLSANDDMRRMYANGDIPPGETPC